MPIYEYVCLDCGERFEVLRSMKEADAPFPCQQCESHNISRQLSRFNAQSGGRVIASGSSGCAGCSGGTCSSCHN